MPAKKATTKKATTKKATTKKASTKKPSTKKPSTKKPSTNTKTQIFTDDERAAMKERAKEQKAAARKGAEEDGASEVLAKLAELSANDRAMGERVHAVITANAPDLSPRLWYGMPAYAKNGKVVCHFQPAEKFKSRYATLGFSDEAKLDDGNIWPNAFALTRMTADVEEKIASLVKKAVG
jgi:uncharacterized protein YdhG (YjbR/CyaY superfamily)